MTTQSSDDRQGLMTVWTTCSFDGIHRWLDAPEEVAFLRMPHHHRFDVRVTVAVDGDGRDVEFILLRRWTLEAIDQLREEHDEATLEWSCETWARKIAGRLNAAFDLDVASVSVSEEGVSGATFLC